MASLMENLINVLQEENAAYESLLELSMKKTPIIVASDLEGLSKITDEEQDIVAKINRLDAKRAEHTQDIANVLNKDVKNLKLADIIEIMAARPKEQKALAQVHDALKDTIGQLARVNEQNKELIASSLEMVEFNMNLVQSMRSAPETANYTKGAYNSGSIMGRGNGGFDAKQ